MVVVVNRHQFSGKGEYVGRPGALGNPYEIGKDGTRDEVVEKYGPWLRREWVKGGMVKAALLKLVGLAKMGDLHLVCSCKPKRCHGDILKQVVETLVSKGY